jgi:hypothetical protein
MKFTQADWEAVNGTSLQGYITATYDQLVERFGQPEGGGDKTTVEWMLQFADGTVATIYDWKVDETPTSMYNWHIGGVNKTAVTRVTQSLKQRATV